MSISKILIANRGEIACRVIETARRLGIASVAVYSDADRHALHVRQADEAVRIGGAASSESYLNIAAILAAVEKSGADAVHPGFGFLSENAAFATALEKAGVVFIGPGVRAIESMGDKIESKKIAAEAGVNTVPGHPDAVADADEAYRIAESIGCPVMLKASAGGGGKGMRVADTLDDVRAGFEAARNEARTAFGDDRVFVEKFIEEPRHIEIQLIADTHGNCLYLHERECSIQRRHQKVVEEAPSPFIDPDTRRAMGEQAIALARAVDYRSAGTVEFIVDKERNFYFLEMNTRLQVEHPVTECITGLDLVELMIDVAAGKALPLTQEEIRLDGWAFEARVYAEDPDRGFLPSTGRVSHYEPPRPRTRVADIVALAAGRDEPGPADDPTPIGEAANAGDVRHAVPDDVPSPFVRVDTGIDAGGEISMHYDPMIAKLVTWASTREAAIETMREAIARYRIEGVSHNLPFLAALFAHPALQAGELTTRFIEDHFADGFDSRAHESEAMEELPVVAAWLERCLRERDRTPVDAPPLASSSVMASSRHPSVSADGAAEAMTREAPGTLSVLEGTERIDVPAERLDAVASDWTPGGVLFDGQVGLRKLRVGVRRDGNAWELSHDGSRRRYRVVDPHVAELAALMPAKAGRDLSKLLLSPMPGLLTKVLVAEGDEVTPGQDLAVIEAMKMENTLKAAVNGTVSEVKAAPGDSLVVDAVILEFE